MNSGRTLVSKRLSLSPQSEGLVQQELTEVLEKAAQDLVEEVLMEIAGDGVESPLGTLCEPYHPHPPHHGDEKEDGEG